MVIHFHELDLNTIFCIVFYMSDVYSLMKYLTPYELDHIKFLAHNDEIPYQIINLQYNINKNDVKNLMRFMLNDQDYLKWKKIYNKTH